MSRSEPESPAFTAGLTRRQVQVAEGLVRQLTLKEIGRQLDISTSAVSKHIAALKAAYRAHSRAEIVSAFLAGHSAQGVEKVAWADFHLPNPETQTAKAASDDPGLLGFADGADYPLDAVDGVTIDWPALNEPQVVPRWLDGNNATPARLAVVFGIMFAVIAGFVLLVNLAMTTSSLIGGSYPDLALQNGPAW